MRYDNLHTLVAHSSSARKYFLSLPVEIQKELQSHNRLIHSSADLRIQADLVEKHNRAVMLSDMHTLHLHVFPPL